MFIGVSVWLGCSGIRLQAEAQLGWSGIRVAG